MNKINGRARPFALALACGVLVVFSPPAQADLVGYSYYFTQITSNGGATLDPHQLSVLVAAVDDNATQVSFTFYNQGGVQSSITDVYFDDGTLLDMASIDNGSGVAFSQYATPHNLPGGNLINPPFVTTKGFSADSDSPVLANGVNNTANSSEWVTITFDLLSRKTLADTIAAFVSGDLRIGLKVQGYANGQSESFVSTSGQHPNPHPVPVPDGGSTVALFGIVMIGAEALRRKFCRS